jgi:hypothetical protein
MTAVIRESKRRTLRPAAVSFAVNPAQAEPRLRPSLPNYFFLYVFFLAFLAFFAAFFAFLAIASSFGLMDGNATPRPARGGLASQQPQLSSEQIRWLVSRGVTPVS